MKNYLKIEDFYNKEHSTLEIIDVRSPSEFLKDHIPGSVNYPVLNDEERSQVGEIYSTNPFEAKKIGSALICRNLAKLIETVWSKKDKSWTPVLYCWRGGQRSKSVAHIFEKIGWKSWIIEGGYKSYRRYVLKNTIKIVNNLSLIVICGLTGSGKTRLLNCLGKKKQILDLEEIASHRGSLLGSIPSKLQPSQKMFESMLLQKLKALDLEKKIYVESESKKIGNIHIPESLINIMRKSECIWIELPDKERVKLLCEEYQHFINDQEKLKPLISKLKEINKLPDHFKCEGLENKENLNKLVLNLLKYHYDPAYEKSIQKNFTKVQNARKMNIKNLKNYSDIAAEEFKRLG